MPVKKVKTIKVNGENYELFPVGVLAEELGRTSQTVRKWEIAGVLPDSLFKDKMQRRYYTREQINVIVRTAEECNLKQGSTTAHFSKKVHKALEEHNKIYLKGDV